MTPEQQALVNKAQRSLDAAQNLIQQGFRLNMEAWDVQSTLGQNRYPS